MKEINMNIHQFMEMERGTKSLKNIVSENSAESSSFRLGNLVLLLAIFLPILTSIPAKAATLESQTSDVVKAIYISAYLMADFFYNVVVNTTVALV